MRRFHRHVDARIHKEPADSEAAIRESISRIYDAALDSTLWSPVLTELCDHAGAAACHVFVCNTQSQSVPFSSVGRYPREAEEEYLLDYAALDRRLERGLALPSGTTFNTRTLMSEQELKACPVHNECLDKWGLYWTMGQTQQVAPGEILIYSALRPKEKSLFDPREMQQWLMFMPHVERAIEISRRLAAVDSQHNSLMDAIDRLSVGVMFVDASGRVKEANATARAVLAERDGLTAPNAQLQAHLGEERKALYRLIHNAADGAHATSMDPGGRLLVTRPSYKRSYSLLVFPCSEQSANWPSMPGTTIVMVTDPERSDGNLAGLIQELYGLTPAEARLTEALATGQTLNEFAETSRLSLHTARSRVKQIFTKTGTRGQADLVRLVLTDCAVGTVPRPQSR